MNKEELTAAEERQENELKALQSIFQEDFRGPPPNKWIKKEKDGSMPDQAQKTKRIGPLEFIVKVAHPRYRDKITFDMKIMFPKAYPTNAAPFCSIVPPIVGITKDQKVSLENLIPAIIRQNSGEEMAFNIIMSCVNWLEENITPPVESLGSLAKEMERRNLEEKRDLEEKRHKRAQAEEMRAQEAKADFMQQLEQDTRRKHDLFRQEKERHKARRRAMSDATEKPMMDVETEVFDDMISIGDSQFNSVKLYHGRNDSLGVTYSAEPVFEDSVSSDFAPLEVHVVLFESAYYTNNQGRKKLRQVEKELRKLIEISDKNVIRTYAVQLTIPKSSDPSKLSILRERRPALTLQDILAECDALKEERVSSYLAQILRGLHAIHSGELVHRGICPKSIAFTDNEDGMTGKGVKIIDVSCEVKLLDMHKSEPFGPKSRISPEPSALNYGWLPHEALQSSKYTRERDLHAVGVVIIQMLMGLDVVNQFSTPEAAVQFREPKSPLLSIAADMLVQSKKASLSCLSLLGRLSETSQIRPPPRSRTTTGEEVNSQDSIINRKGKEPIRNIQKSNSERTRLSSRWLEDWEYLEEIGKGGFGEVVKARNRIDQRAYAVKIIQLKPTRDENEGKFGSFDRIDKNDRKIFREVTALSRLTHRNIVRYYTSWVEESILLASTAPSEAGIDEEDLPNTEEKTQTQTARNHDEEAAEQFVINFDDLGSTGGSGTSFPSVFFTSGDTMSGSEDEDEGEGEDEEADGASAIRLPSANISLRRSGSVKKLEDESKLPSKQRTIYIQMEFVENKTLAERIESNLSEDECWRLFLQILDALVYMSSLGILHRDIKCKNIFIDECGDCKVGDFGLATTSSLPVLDASADASRKNASIAASEFTMDVGTRLYMAPEILPRKKGSREHRKGPRDYTKADMYSLGIVFFEMNYRMATQSERVHVLENLRKEEIIFPKDWDTKRVVQREIITALLDHDISKRPEAKELAHSKLLPKRIEKDYFEEAVREITLPESPYYQSVLSSLFQLSAPPARGFIYDSDLPETSTLKGLVVERLTKIFTLHGARNVDIPLLMPKSTGVIEDDRQVSFLDKYGEVVCIASNAIVPFARSASRSGATRIKRYNFSELYKDALMPGHPKFSTAAVFDIISTDLQNGPSVAVAELISLASELMKVFPRLSENYVIKISHSNLLDLVLERVHHELRDTVLDILAEVDFTVIGATRGAWRSALSKKGIIRSAVDDIETLASKWDNVGDAQDRLDKTASVLSLAAKPYLEEIKHVTELVRLCGVPCDFIALHPMTCKRSSYFHGGIYFEVARRTKKTDVIAAGGRYDRLIESFSTPLHQTEPFCAFAIQIAFERITANLVEFQKASMSRLKTQRSYGYWSLRRCDVYIASFQPGLLLERLELVSLLWKNGISADVMYEGSVESNSEDILEQCSHEGILFAVFVKGVRKDLNLKVKNVLSGSETETTKYEIVPLLQQLIHEQNRFDVQTSGVASGTEMGSPMKETASQASTSSNVPIQIVLPGDVKKIRRQTKQMFTDKGYDAFTVLKTQMQSGSIPMLVVDVPPTVFEAMAQSNIWVSDDDVWRAIAQRFPTQHVGYASQIHEAVLARKEEGVEFVLLFSCKDDRTALLKLT